MPLCRNNFTSASSVSLLPCPRIRDIISDRLALVKTSAMQSVVFALAGKVNQQGELLLEF